MLARAERRRFPTGPRDSIAQVGQLVRGQRGVVDAAVTTVQADGVATPKQLPQKRRNARVVKPVPAVDALWLAQRQKEERDLMPSALVGLEHPVEGIAGVEALHTENSGGRMAQRPAGQMRIALMQKRNGCVTQRRQPRRQEG